MDLLDLLLPPVFGFVIGFVTNAVAILMLFRPYEEVRFLGLRFQGMVSRRKADIARSVAHTVASQLLREDRVAQRLVGEETRRALEELIHDLVGRYAATEYGTLASVLGDSRVHAVEAAVGQLVVEASRAAQGWAATPDGVRVVISVLQAVLERSPAELLGSEEALVSGVAVRTITEALAAPELETRVRGVLAHLVVRLAGAETPLADLLPAEAREALLHTVRSVMPTLLRRFEEALLSPSNVEKLKGAVRSGIEDYLLEAKGGVVRNLVRQAALLGRRRIFREADEVVDANLHRLKELVYEEENKAHLETSIAAGIDTLLRRTPGELLRALPPQTVDLLFERASARICRYLYRPEVAEAVGRGFEREIERIFHRPLREWVEASGFAEGAQARWAERLAGWASDGGLETLARREAPILAKAVLETPIGTPSRFLTENLVREITAIALDHLMPVLVSKVPEILRIVNAQSLIEREILEFSPRELERVILGVAKRELHAITWWGGVLGALVGGLQTLMAVWRLH